MRQLSILVFGLIVITSSCAHGQQTKSDQRFDTLFNQLNAIGFNGNIAVINKNDAVIKSFGFADKSKNIQTSQSTIYDIGSVTKQFTAAAIMKLQMDGKLRVENKIGHYFDNVPQQYKNVTIHHLLTHTAGLPSAIGNDEEQISKEDYLAKVWATQPEKNTAVPFSYSNVGYTLLAMIIEDITDMNYENYLREELFIPSKMYNTGYVLPEFKEVDIAVGYNENSTSGKPHQQNWNEDGPSWHLKGNGGILSTVEDMLLWNKSLKDHLVLSKEATDLMYHKHTAEGETQTSYYGYGWALFPTPRNTTLVTHNGGNGYFFCDFLRYLKEDLTILILTNSAKPEFHQLGFQIAKTIFDDNHIPQIMLSNEANKTISIQDHPNGLLIEQLVEVLYKGNDQSLRSFVEENFHDNLKNVAPIGQHIKILKQMGSEINSNLIDNLEINGTETTLSFVKSNYNLTITIERHKINGLGVNDAR